MGTFIDMTGQRFGRLLLLGRAPNKGTRTTWYYRCDCGREGIVIGASLRHCDQQSCGCLQREAAARIGRNNAIHGHARKHARTPTYSSWRAMMERTSQPNHHAWANYGGRGIVVCNRWTKGEDGLTGYECFLEDMGERPKGTSIDRIDNAGNYEPSNCRWATDAQQMRNRRSVIMKPESVARLREMAKAKVCSVPELARRFSISKAQAYRIVNGQRWMA